MTSNCYVVINHFSVSTVVSRSLLILILSNTWQYTVVKHHITVIIVMNPSQEKIHLLHIWKLMKNSQRHNSVNLQVNFLQIASLFVNYFIVSSAARVFLPGVISSDTC